MVHDTSAHEPVQRPASDTIERGEEVSEGVTSGPECSAIIAKQIIDQRNGFGKAASSFGDTFLCITVEPQICRPIVSLNFYPRLGNVRQTAHADDPAISSEKNAVEIINGGVVYCFFDHPDRLRHAEYRMISDLDVSFRFYQTYFQERQNSQRSIG
jgi:hypothetical protein